MNFDESPLSNLIAEEFGSERLAAELVGEFLDRGSYDRGFAVRLVEVAGARGCAPSWPLRRATVLMLESQLFALPAEENDELGEVLRAIAADPDCGLRFPPDPSVLAEGYSSADWPVFAAELRARMARHERIHRRIDGPETSPGALGDFLELARQECKLTLARYLFRPGEVVGRILEQVRTSRGLPEPLDGKVARVEAERFLSDLPEYERAIAAALVARSCVFWVEDSTSSRLNSLVEYPAGTVVLVIKPPGSCLELEIKRAGRRGDCPLSVVHEHEQWCVPPTHRLDGGSMGNSLRTEATSGALLARLFRLIHGRDAPMSRSLAFCSIYEVPCARGRAQVLDYFTDPDAFSGDFDAMREALRRSILSFGSEWGSKPLELPGDLGPTVAFINQVAPSQAILGGTSSFRLELLSTYLSDKGPDAYFRRGLGVEPSADDVRRFQQTLLEEIIGSLAPVEIEPRAGESFVDAALAIAENRQRADAVYLDLTAQIGRFWGTVFALKFYSHGESFVGRNVGLSSVWDRGQWRPRLIFMDHDVLTVDRDAFRPGGVIGACWRDALYVFGNPVGNRKGELDYLASIYRATATLRQRGWASVLSAARGAFRLTREKMAGDVRVRSFFKPEVLACELDWDDAAAAYLRARGSGLDIEPARDAGAEFLRLCGHPEDLVAAYMDAVVKYTEYLEAFAEVFDVAPIESHQEARQKQAV
jgi:hypothetical protein